MVDPYTLSAKYYDHIYLTKSQDMYKYSIRDVYHFSNELLGRNPKSVLDIGCGTGTHAVKLAEDKIKVVGIDISQDILDIAKKKIREGLDIEFIQADMSKYIDLGQKFEVGAAFFGSFCYLHEDNQVEDFLANCENWISTKGFLFFEFWNTLAVKDGSQHFFETEHDGIRLLRFNDASLDINTGIVSMPMHHIIFKNDKLIADFTEDHKMKTYTIPYLKSLIRHSNWKIHALYSWKEGERTAPKKEDFRYNIVLKRK